jgi:hypothetical protein
MNYMNKSIYYITVLIIILVGVSFFFWFNYNHKTLFTQPQVYANPDLLAGIQTGNEPWSPEINNLQKRLSEIGLPALAQEGTTLHTHQHLDILINGNQITVPANIGIDDAKGFISPIHTHDQTGIMHVESPVTENFYLGQFFDIWGVRLTSSCIGGYCSAKDKSLKIFVNGSLFNGNPRTVELQAHQEITIAYGTISQMPFPTPSSYDFPTGY